MKASIYSTNTGQILRIVDSPNELLTLQLQEGETYLEGLIDDSKYYIENGGAVELPSQPSQYHIFDWNTKVWYDPRGLQDFKSSKWAEIKAARDVTEFGTFVWNNHVFDATPASQQRIAGAVQLAAIVPTYSVTWTLADNSTILLTAADLLEVGVALGQHVAAAHEKARLLRQAIDSATTIAEVQALNW